GGLRRGLLLCRGLLRGRGLFLGGLLPTHGFSGGRITVVSSGSGLRAPARSYLVPHMTWHISQSRVSRPCGVVSSGKRSDTRIAIARRRSIFGFGSGDCMAVAIACRTSASLSKCGPPVG